MFRSLLVPLDLSPASDRVVGRVALLPLAKSARITLLHVIPRPLPARAQKRVRAEAEEALAAKARRLEEALPNSVSIATVVTVGGPAAEIASRASSLKAELVVMGRGGGRILRDVFLGSTAERVLRSAQLPVLVVRLLAREPYHRPAIALDADRAAFSLVDSLLRVVTPPRPVIEVIHAYDAPYEGMLYSTVSDADALEYRDHYRKEALAEIGKLLATALAEAKVAPEEARSFRTRVRYGAPRDVVERAVKTGNHDLLVLGTHGFSGLAYAFLGTVAGDVLRQVGCDVLVVPPHGAAARKG